MALSNIARKQVLLNRAEDIITFVESPSGLNQKLYPVQRFILKVLEKEPLDDTRKDVLVNNKFNTGVEFEFTEKGYYDYLLEHGRVSCPYEDYVNSEQTSFQLVMGRRGAKTTTIAVFVCYKLYQILLHPHPQLMFNIMENSPLNITMVALGKDNADKLFSKFYKLMCDSRFFKPYMLEPATGSTLKLWTQHDIEKLNGEPPTAHSNSITISSSPNTPGVRGDDNLFCIMDELAHYNNSPNSTREQPLDELIYNALVPSTSAFTLKGTNKLFGKTFIFSSPNGKKGLFYKEYLNAFEYGAESMSWCMQAPTWETNPSVASAILKKEYRLHPSTYNVEYGAEFDEVNGAWFEDRTPLLASVLKDENPTPKFGDLKKAYFLGADFGLANDGTAFSICHVEYNYRPDWRRFTNDYLSLNEEVKKPVKLLEELENRCEEIESSENPDTEKLAALVAKAKALTESTPILKPVSEMYIIDYTHVEFPGKGDWADHRLLPMNEMLDWLGDLYNHFPIVYGITDQWASQLTQQLIDERFFSSKFRAVNHSSTINDSQYKLFQLLIFQNQVRLPDDPETILELSKLQCHNISKNVIKVEAPPGKQNHDDRFDSIIRSIWLAHTYYHDPKTLETVGIKCAPQTFIPMTSAARNPIMREKMKASRYTLNARIGGRAPMRGY